MRVRARHMLCAFICMDGAVIIDSPDSLLIRDDVCVGGALFRRSSPWRRAVLPSSYFFVSSRDHTFA